MNPLKRRQSQVPERRRKRTAISEIDQSTAFSRGRTLTGSASSQVHTLSETSADLKSPRVQAHALRKKRRQLIGWLALATALAGLFYILTSQFTAKITVQAAPDPSVQLEPVYTEAIEAYLSDHIGERWRLFTDEAQLTAAVQATAPEVKSVDVKGSAGFGASYFTLTFRQPIHFADERNRARRGVR